MQIKRLKSDVISTIRSSFNLNSVAQCVYELVCNSLDAKSTSIAVRINLITFKIQVADNGEGVTKENLDLLGIRYMTNKCHNLGELEKHLNTYGFRGEALASIVDMCKSLSITSKCKDSSETYDRTLSRDLRSEVKLSKHRASVGTTVTILGLLSNLPVRQQRVIQEIELEEVKNYMENLVVINPGSSFSLRNDVTGLLVLNSPKSADIIGSFRHLHPDVTDSFTLLKVSKNKLSIDALIHKDVIFSKKFQYVYVNKKPVISYRILKHLNGSFYKKMQLKTKRSKHPIFQTKKYPVFVLNIKCPQSCVDIFMGPSKHDVEFKCWDLVLACIEKIIRTFFGLDGKESKAAPERRSDARISCGVSQVVGAVQACGYKRKSDGAIAVNDRLIQDCSQNRPGCIKKSRLPRSEEKKKSHPLEGDKNILQGFVRDRTTILTSQSSTNYQIEDSGNQKPFLKPRKLKSIIKKPLPIRVEQSIRERVRNSERETMTKPDQAKHFDLADSRTEEQQIVQFDQRSVYSKLTNDENQGKNLIMDMFLKSTQVFCGEEGMSTIGKQTGPNISGDTIEESNFVMENNIEDTARGINTTMSISVNVKKKLMKDQKKKASKCIQTSIVEDRLDKMTSKGVQTSQKPALVRIGSNLSDLTDKFDGFKLSHEYRENEKDNYTILINTVRKRKEFRFVRKSEDMDVDNSEEEQSFRPLKICHCHEDGGKIFRFDQGQKRDVLTLNDKNNFGPTSALKTLFQKPSKQHMSNILAKSSSKNDEDSETIFKKPQGPAVNQNQNQNQNLNGKIRINNLNFRGVRKHAAPTQVELCERSPFFSKSNVPRYRSRTAVASANNNSEPATADNSQPSYKCFQPRLGNTRQNDLKQPRNIVSSPYFARNCREYPRETDMYLARPLRNEYFEPPHVNQIQNCLTKGFPPYNLNQLYPNEYEDLGYHNYQQNFPRRHFMDTNIIANRNMCQIGYDGNYGRQQNTNLMPHSCCQENMCLPENRQYFGMDHVNYNGPKQTFSRYIGGDTWHRNRGNINIEAGAQCIRPRGNFPDTDIQIPKLPQNDCGVKFNEPINVVRENTIAEPFVDKAAQNLQAMDENELDSIEWWSPWYTPNVSDKSMYFERSSSKSEELRSDKDASVLCELPNLSANKNAMELEEKGDVEEKNTFNFKFDCTPDIFSSDVIDKTEKSVDVNKKSRDAYGDNLQGNRQDVVKVPSQNIADDFNDFFDLPSFGIKSKTACRTTNTVCPSKDGSDLEITMPGDDEKQNIIEKELVDARKQNTTHSFSRESEVGGKEMNNKEQSNEKSRIIVDSQNEWIKKYNVNGKGFYINSRTGMVTASTPKIDEGFFVFDKRLNFVPKGMSPVLKEHKRIDRSLSQNAKSKLHQFILESYENELMVIKWQRFIYDDPKKFFDEIYKEKSKQFENGIPSIHDGTVKNKLQKDTVGFNSKLFKTIEVIGQVDGKFIAVLERTKNMLLLFDQHAVHERIRVEQFLKAYKGRGTPCEEKLTFFMPRNDLSLLKKHSAYLSSLGFDVEFFTDGLRVLNIPLCVQEKFNSQDNSEELGKLTNTLIKEIIESLKETRGSTSHLPKIIQNVINLKACRGAIKFGDILTKEDCVKLLNDLSKCNLPFQCAHGRPTLTPVLTLSKIEVKGKINKLALKKLLR